jgi:hypothetical protein
LALPKKEQSKPEWQNAAEVLRHAAAHGGPFVFIARISFAKALFGEDKPPLGNPAGKKAHRWGKAEAGERSVKLFLIEIGIEIGRSNRLCNQMRFQKLTAPHGSLLSHVPP